MQGILFGWKSLYWHVIVFHYATADRARKKGVVILWENHQHVTNSCEISGMLNICTCLQFKILLCEISSDWTIHTMTSTQWESKIQGSGKFRGSYRPQYQQSFSPASPQPFPHPYVVFFIFILFCPFAVNQRTDHLYHKCLAGYHFNHIF